MRHGVVWRQRQYLGQRGFGRREPCGPVAGQHGSSTHGVDERRTGRISNRISTKPGRVIFVVINRSTSDQVTTIDGQPLSGTAHLYQMTATTAANQSPIQPVAAGTLTPAGSKLTVTLPPLSVTTIDVF